MKWGEFFYVYFCMQEFVLKINLNTYPTYGFWLLLISNMWHECSHFMITTNQLFVSNRHIVVNIIIHGRQLLFTYNLRKCVQNSATASLTSMNLNCALYWTILLFVLPLMVR